MGVTSRKANVLSSLSTTIHAYDDRASSYFRRDRATSDLAILLVKGKISLTKNEEFKRENRNQNSTHTLTLPQPHAYTCV